jgi:hypothetical protein
MESPESMIHAPKITASNPPWSLCFRADSPVASQQQREPAPPPTWHIWYALDETETDEDVEVRKRNSYEHQTQELDRAIRVVWGFGTADRKVVGRRRRESGLGSCLQSLIAMKMMTHSIENKSCSL